MSWSERSVRSHKRQTDGAIRHAYARLATDALAVAKFHELLREATTGYMTAGRLPQFSSDIFRANCMAASGVVEVPISVSR
jgi:hypothetical protein